MQGLQQEAVTSAFILRCTRGGTGLPGFCLKVVISTLCYFCDLGYLLLHLAKDYQACLILNCVDSAWYPPPPCRLLVALQQKSLHASVEVPPTSAESFPGDDTAGVPAQSVCVCAQFGGVSSRAQSSWSFPKLKGDSKGGATPSSFDRACLLRILDRSIPSISCHWTTPCSGASALRLRKRHFCGRYEKSHQSPACAYKSQTWHSLCRARKAD